MLDVLLVRIQPTDVLHSSMPEDFEYFNEKTLDFKISVLNGAPLQFKASKKYYFDPKNSNARESILDEKTKEIDKELGVSHRGIVVAIDKYPYSQFEDGVKIHEEQDSNRSRYDSFSRYEIECQSENFDYHSIILLVPGREPTILSTLKFACSDERGFRSSVIVFKKEAVLSLRSAFGEVISIALQHHNKSALKPDHAGLCYTMSFEKVSLPAVILQKLLETKPQSESEPHEETHE